MTLVTGGSGMVGKSLRKIMPDATFVSSSEYDLRCKDKVSQCFNDIKPDVVVHLAARVGGIVANSSQQYDFFYDNIMINTNVLHEAICRNNYIVYISSTCAYPKYEMTYPLVESVAFSGEPEETNRSYAYAKRMGQVQLESAKSQFDVDSCTIYFSNLYGVNDCFDLNRSHFISAAIRKIHEAKVKGDSVLKLLGTGNPLRQFTFVDDASLSIKKICDSRVNGVFNLSNPKSNSISDAAYVIKTIVGYDGNIVFNGDLDGLHCKDVSVEKFMNRFPDFKFTQLEEGVKETYSWYIQNET